MYKYLEVRDINFEREIILNRADVHNAFNDEFISELTKVFKETNQNKSLRLLVLKANGKSFCAGADLQWMKRMKNYSLEENEQDSLKLAQMFQALDDVNIPVLTIAKGYTLGGGTGLLACSDYVLAEEKSQFGFTEVNLGLIPAVISPFVIRKIGYSCTRAYFLNGMRFNCNVAKDMKLIHEVVSDSLLEQREEKLRKIFLQSSPHAVSVCKDFVNTMFSKIDDPNINEFTSQEIAKIRVHDQAQLGMNALLNKEKVDWTKI